MTTQVTIEAHGTNYPVRITQEGKDDIMLADGFVYKFCPSGPVTITEEYHPEGYPAPKPVEQPEAEQAPAAPQELQDAVDDATAE